MTGLSLICAVVALLALSPAAAAQTSPVGLAGENLISRGFDRSKVEISCNPSGTSTYSFVGEGAATGPYPGTFTESGTVTIGPQTGDSVNFVGLFFAGGPIVTVTTSFRIESGNTVITGTKQLLSTAPAHAGTCTNFEGLDIPSSRIEDAFGTAFTAHALLSYTATIHTPTGRYRDSGTASLLVHDFDFDSTSDLLGPRGFSFMQESFLASDGVIRLLPTNADGCKNGSFKTFGVFKNQGDCVAFVATGGRNEPGKNLPGLP